MTQVLIKRAYEPPAPSDGYRVLVDRVWPRGVTKSKAHLDDWQKEVAPSTTLRKWFGHKPERWIEFRRRYRAELAENPAAKALRTAMKSKRRVTLVYSARDEEHNQAVVLAGYLQGTRKKA